MPRTTFTTSTPITSEFLNKVARPRIGTVDDDGVIAPITNAGLDNQPGSLLYDFYDYVDSLAVVSNPQGGLSVIVKGGTVRKTDNDMAIVAENVRSVPDNSVSFVWIDFNAQVRVTPMRPTFGAILARVTTVNGRDTSIQDLRVTVTILPQPNLIPSFGGQSQTDYVIPANTTVNLSGLIECRNFFLPANSTLRINGESLYIRASGNVDLLGTVNTLYRPLTPIQNITRIGGTTVAANLSLGFTVVNSSANSVRSRKKNNSYSGALSFDVIGATTANNRAVFATLNSTNLIQDPAAPGADLTVNAAGIITIGTGANINLVAKDSTRPPSPEYPTTAVIGSAHPTTGLLTESWQVNLQFGSSQSIPGNLVLQSATSINLNQNATINCKGARESWAIFYDQNQTQSVVPQLQFGGGGNWKNGATGGGGVWLCAPSINQHPSVTIDVSAGTMGTPSPTNLYVPGLGAVGKGYSGNNNAALDSSTEPKPGTLTVIFGYPVEF